jgi:hypothetical protein
MYLNKTERIVLVTGANRGTRHETIGRHDT